MVLRMHSGVRGVDKRYSPTGPTRHDHTIGSLPDGFLLSACALVREEMVSRQRA